MSRFSNLLRGAIGLGAIASIAACGDSDRKLLVPTNPAGGDMVRSYVAMGNSITAGWQSGGINDSTQRASYANLFALQAGARFAYPSFVSKFQVGTTVIGTGCPVPLGNYRSGKLIDSLAPTPGGCALRDANKLTDVLNNVAVPFAYASDATVTGSGVKIPVPPHTFILGGKAQVDRALEAEPTFVSVWFGNNETLAPASVGLLAGLSSASPAIPALVTAAEFETAMETLLDSLTSARPGLKGVLFGATKVTNAPRFFAADSLFNATKLGTLNTYTGKTITVLPNCVGAGYLVSAEIAPRIKAFTGTPDAATHPPFISCGPTGNPALPPPIGDIFMLSPTEIAALNSATDAYNVYLSAKATELGWAYVDPNPILEAQRTGATPAIPAFPNFTSNTRDAATAPFGALFSLDGVHPSAAGHKIIANAMIDAVNATSGTSIPRVP